MKTHSTEKWSQTHNFNHHNYEGEKNTRYVLILTVVTMIIEIVAGTVYGSMALLADGWHMGTHAAAFMITLFAYHYARKHADSPQFAFGTGKVSVLGGFTSAIALGMVALLMLAESLSRIVNPHEIQFEQAIFVAVIGLTVNIVSAFLLKDHHSHDHHDHHDHHSHAHHSNEHSHHGHHHHDHNLNAAYMHVLADALTSLLAIFALVLGKYLGWLWLDPIMGVVGAIIITKWAYGLIMHTSPILLDDNQAAKQQEAIKVYVEQHYACVISDIHLWRANSADFVLVLSVVTHEQIDNLQFKRQLQSKFNQVKHITLEVHQCDLPECAAEIVN
ncbi:CDF family Co(II)/Ni(II) efflux transporter DmeF [Shewanella subflava]|uniref:CDF family Co(II)/Ni(II) efflux transporter DmeF n=1 Tax=Shewanella subflava TaxID=2986476 RepID=A0ABT3IA05_9GAMM|nr:CDF family Co(II)/Ni(II) efflux transporter DmeF [Shewanella subflava]MCW3172890.1 CDF family Co(II)/Ni(II) efflux transporter DmeF [Shewanella subflava]